MKNTELMEHITSVNNERKLECGICGKQCTEVKSLKSHIQRHWNTRYQCILCDRSFALNTSLKAHIRGVHEGERLVCSVEGCGRTFLEKKTLDAHMKIHNCEFAFKCEICSKGFTHKTQFEGHMNRHYGIKPYECAICGRKYTYATDLKQHVSVCGEEKTEKCEFCDKSFVCQKYLKGHVKSVHSKCQPYLCNMCGQEFHHRSAIHRHMKSHA